MTTNPDALRAAEAWRENAQNAGTAIRMIRDAIGELFGPVASLESEDAVLLRGPEDVHDAEAIIAALQRVVAAFPSAAGEAVAIVPDGWKLVPLKMTDEMQDAFREELLILEETGVRFEPYEEATCWELTQVPEGWSAALAVAPAPPAPDAGREAVMAERNACAQLADALHIRKSERTEFGSGYNKALENYAAAIRARLAP